MAKKNEKIVWHDRKRTIFGLPLSFTSYSIDDERLYTKKGFFHTTMNEILLYRILDIKTDRSFFQKLNGIGTVTLYCADQSDRTIPLVNIKKPEETHRLISDIVERERVEHGVAGREIYGTAGYDMDHMDGSCDAHDEHHDLGEMPAPPPRF